MILIPRHRPIVIGLVGICMLLFWLVILPKSHAYTPQQGDIIFQTSHSSQSLAIQQATHSVYSHMGIILFKDGQPYVYEAAQRVKFTPMKQWIAQGAKGKFVAKRSKTSLTGEQKALLYQVAQEYLNRPYDLTFSWSDERIYCSELVWKIYFNALGLKVGKQQKLGDFDLRSPVVKAKLVERYGINIPQDKIVISPKAMFDSSLLVIVGKN